MPNRDGTGPTGQGKGAGKGRGPCGQGGQKGMGQGQGGQGGQGKRNRQGQKPAAQPSSPDGQR